MNKGSHLATEKVKFPESLYVSRLYDLTGVEKAFLICPGQEMERRESSSS